MFRIVLIVGVVVATATPEAAAQYKQPKLLRLQKLESPGKYRAIFDADVRVQHTSPVISLIRKTGNVVFGRKEAVEISGKEAVITIQFLGGARSAPGIQSLLWKGEVGGNLVVYETEVTSRLEQGTGYDLGAALGVMDAFMRGHKDIEKDELIVLRTTFRAKGPESRALSITLSYSGGQYDRARARN